jgi:CRP/FNR family transcriptional regulator
MTEILAKTPLFGGLAPLALENLAAHAERRQVAPGTAVFAEGDVATGFYVVATGRVRVYKASPDGKEQTLHIFGPGQAVGEAAVFIGGAFPAHAEALEPSILVYLPREAFLAFIRSHPEAALDMLGLMSRRLMRFTTMIENLSLKEAPARLAAYLLHLSQKQASDQVVLDTSKSQLAGILGTTPETLSRTLTRLSREGAIAQVEGRRIAITDRGLLQAVSEGERRLS